jgi:hypothetical protein
VGPPTKLKSKNLQYFRIRILPFRSPVR